MLAARGVEHGVFVLRNDRRELLTERQRSARVRGTLTLARRQPIGDEQARRPGGVACAPARWAEFDVEPLTIALERPPNAELSRRRDQSMTRRHFVAEPHIAEEREQPRGEIQHRTRIRSARLGARRTRREAAKIRC